MKKIAIFGFERSQQQALAQRLAPRPRTATPWPTLVAAAVEVAGAQHLDPDPDQVDRAGDLQREERDRRGLQQRGEPSAAAIAPDASARS